MKTCTLLKALAFLVSVYLLLCSRLVAQELEPDPDMVVIQPPTQIAENIINEYIPLPETDPLATVVFPNGYLIEARTRDGSSPLMGILANETVNVQLTFPATCIGQTILTEALDSGLATAARPDETLGSDGMVPFVFTAGDQPGLYRIVIKVGETVSTLQFWVANLEDPSVNPPVLLPQPPPAG